MGRGEDKAFNKIKKALLWAPALELPGFIKTCHLYVDERNGIANGVLTQTLGQLSTCHRNPLFLSSSSEHHPRLLPPEGDVGGLKPLPFSRTICLLLLSSWISMVNGWGWGGALGAWEMVWTEGTLLFSRPVGLKKEVLSRSAE